MINGNYKNLTIYLLFFQVSIFDHIEDIEHQPRMILKIKCQNWKSTYKYF